MQVTVPLTATVKRSSAIVVTLAMLLHLINCRFIVFVVIIIIIIIILSQGCSCSVKTSKMKVCFNIFELNYFRVVSHNKCIYRLHRGLFPLILHQQSARFQGMR